MKIKFIRDLNRQGMTILPIAHYMEEAEFLCDRIGIMDSGKLIEQGTLDYFRAKYGKGLNLMWWFQI